MSYYRDLREYLGTLEKRNLLWRIKSSVKRETELMPLVRWQFRGLPEEERRAFLFENVIDRTGRKYKIPVLVGGLAASKAIYATGMGCDISQLAERWVQAETNPIPPRLVKAGPVQEVVHMGEELVKEGLDELPFPIDTPGFDGIQRSSDNNWFSKDPETGKVNIGNYSGHVHAPNRMTVGIGEHQHMRIHMEKAQRMGKPSLSVALVIGVVPAVSFVSVSKVPYGQDEMAVACGLAGEPMEVVKCQTVDIEIPASAEIVIEGEISTRHMETHTGSYGEHSGYMAETHACPVFDITCITHRKNPIFTAIISAMPPSESSKIEQIAREGNLLKFLKYDCGIAGVQNVALYESGSSTEFCVIQMKKSHASQSWQALNAVACFSTQLGKFIVAVDEDIDLCDIESVIWAMSFRVQPHRDTHIVIGKMASLDPSTTPPGSSRQERAYPKPTGASAILIDATRKWDYPPVALPKKEFMERARQIWESEGLPPLKQRTPWHGYDLGYWPQEYEEAARLNLEGKLFEMGERKRLEVKSEK